MRLISAVLIALVLAPVCSAKKKSKPGVGWKPATVLAYRSGAYQAATITNLNSWNWNYGSSATVTTTPVIDSYEAIGLGTCNRALLLYHVVPPIFYRRRFVGALVEGESIAYRWKGKGKVRIKLLQSPKQREFTVPVFKVFDWTQIKPNLLANGFIKLAAYCGPETAFGKVRVAMLARANQSSTPARDALVEGKTVSGPKPAAPLTNNDVSAMIASGLSANVVIAKIESSSCGFDTSPRALERLKRSGLPNSVILAMVKKSSAK